MKSTKKNRRGSRVPSKRNVGRPVKCLGVSVSIDVHNGTGIAVQVRHWADGVMEIQDIKEIKAPNTSFTVSEENANGK